MFEKKNPITKHEAEGLKTTPRFYIQPKIHKQSNGGRPVINN